MGEKFKNLVDMQEKSCETFKNREMYGTKGPNGYEWITFGQYAEMVNNFRGGLASLGVQAGDKIAIISGNSVSWAVGCYATYGLRAHYVPMYESQTVSEWKYIVNDCAAKVLIVSKFEIYNQVKDFLKTVPSLKHIINLSSPETEANSYKALLKVGKEKPVPSQKPDTDETQGFIYTSGTTGNPKGVVLSHGNILSNLNSIHELIDFSPEDRTLCFLPWAHIFGQLAEVHILIYCGYSTGFAEDVSTIIANLSEVRPTVLFSVPRIFNKIYDGVTAKMADEGGLAKILFEMGMQKAALKKTQGYLGLLDTILLAVVDKIVFSKIRNRFGGRLRYAMSGASALSKEVAEFIDNLGIMVFEGYGLSETSPMVSVNSMLGRRIGSVGKVVPGVKVVLDKSIVGENSEDGEIVVYGPNVMKGGYHNLAEATSEVIQADGGFKTGDLGRFDADGFLYITGRIKEQYKLENGKYVAPSHLEEKLKLSPYIQQVMLFGDNKPYNVALVVPEMDQLKKYSAQHGITASGQDLLNDQRIKALIKQEIEHYAQDTFKGYEKPRQFHLISEEWSGANGMLTPTMKLKRRIVVDKYKDILMGMYN